MSHDAPLPALRSVEVLPFEGPGGRQIVLRDVLGVADGPIVLGASAWAIAACLDGRRSLEEVRSRASRLSGLDVPAAEVGELAGQLDALGFLETAAYRDRLARRQDEYRAAAVRPAACAGGAYPDEAGELRRLLDRCLDEAGGRGPRGAGPSLRALVAPHIDLHRGGTVYGHAYRALHEGAADVDTFVVFGTAHASPPHLFTLTRKGFETPLGTVEPDLEVIDRLAAALGEDEAYGDELVHVAEHSIEFQALFLRHLKRGRPARIVPVLCSTLHGTPDAGRDPVVARLHDALAEALRGRDACVIAAADLAHVGIRFGDRRGPTTDELAKHEEQDRSTMGRAAEGDATGFLADTIPTDRLRRICGIAPIYHTLRAAPGARGQLLAYAQAHDVAQGSMVSFAAAALFQEDRCRSSCEPRCPISRAPPSG